MNDDPEITDPRDPHKRRDIVTELDRYLRSDKTFAEAFVDSPSWAALVPPIQRLAKMVQRARDEIVALRAERDKLTWEIIDHAPERDELVALREIAARPSSELHALTKERDEARAEIVGLRGLLEHSDRTVITAVAVATPAIRDEALEDAARLCERVPGDPKHGDFFAAAIRALKNKAEPQS